MTALENDCLHRAAIEAGSKYHRLVLLVGESGRGKSERLRQLAGVVNTEVINVNRTVSKRLLDATEQQRAMNLPQLLADIVATGQPMVFLDNLEVLFDVSLKQDPLRLLQGVSRNTTVIASWNGTIAGDKVVYAEPGHPEYRSYSTADLTIVRC